MCSLTLGSWQAFGPHLLQAILRQNSEDGRKLSCSGH
ncbi:rCG59061 [Rattus norvegicus]|uniref:RCG59061 n=1 Tax=Rattus norvegicus TaxID=10116 RepID=A6JPW9_RAT|nr:rCG59061 [Rattus norvegicus]